jgi:hypothetical protein
MIDVLKKLFVFGGESRIEHAAATVAGMVEQPPVQAMQGVYDWLHQEMRRSEGRKDGLAVLSAVDADLRRIIETATASMLESQSNHTRMVLLLQGAVPFTSSVLSAYTDSLRRDLVELARKSSNASLVQSVVANWLYWLGRDHVIRFMREPKNDRLPWHEIRPTSEFALEQGGGLAAKIGKPDGEAGRLQKQLAHLVLLSRTFTPDLQGRQLLIADRVAGALAAFIRVSDQHSSETPMGQSGDDNNPPTILSQMSLQTKYAGRGLFYGLERSLQELVALEQLIMSAHKVPQKVDPDGKLDVAETLSVIRHLKNRWSGREVRRLSERKPLSGTLTVVHDYGVIRKLIVQVAQGNQAKTVESTMERAAVEDVSATGIGLKLIKHSGWLKVSQLLGVRTDRDVNWRVGIVRRAISQGHGEMLAGVQLLSRDPESIRAKVSQWERVTDVQAWENLLAIYLRPEQLNDNQHVLILEKQELDVGKIYGAPTTREGDLTFRVLGLIEIAADCVLYRCERLAAAAVKDANAPTGPSLYCDLPSSFRI